MSIVLGKEAPDDLDLLLQLGGQLLQSGDILDLQPIKGIFLRLFFELYLDHTWPGGQAQQRRRTHPARRIWILSSAQCSALSASLAFEQGLTWSSWRQGLNRKKRRKLRPNENILSVSHHTSTSDWCQAPKKCPVRLTYAKTRISSAGKMLPADGWKQVQSRRRGTRKVGQPGTRKEGRTWSAGVLDHNLAKMPGTSSVLPVHSKRLCIVHSAATA